MISLTIITFKRTIIYNSKEICGIYKTIDRFTQILMQSTEDYVTVRGHMIMHAHTHTHGGYIGSMGS